jgi:mannosyl-oligosaccharide alpha-1,2-mannosidase
VSTEHASLCSGVELICSWGASIIDTLDSLLVFGLDDEYNLCRPFINQLNFHWVGGKDWSQGYVSPDPIPHPKDDEETSDEVWGIARDRSVTLSVFETTIRYLGGLLGAYDLSGDQLLVERAVDLATVLERAFNTQSGLPAGHMHPGYETNYLSIGSLSIAEAASISLEFMRLGQVTRDRKWYDLAQRVTDYIEDNVIPRSNKGNLIPLSFQPEGKGELYGTYSWGGMADSYYEYLIKTYKLLGGGKAAQQYRRIYEKSVDAARQYIFYDIDIYNWSPSHRDMLGIGKVDSNGIQTHEIEHLSCFAGGMLGMGSKLLDRQQDMNDAEKFTQACYWLSTATPTGLQPEVVEFYEPGFEQWENITTDGYSYLPPSPGEPPLGIKVEERMKGSPAGSKKTVTRGINRPETIESIFYM